MTTTDANGNLHNETGRFTTKQHRENGLGMETLAMVSAVETARYDRQLTLAELEHRAGVTLAEVGSVDRLLQAAHANAETIDADVLRASDGASQPVAGSDVSSDPMSEIWASGRAFKARQDQLATRSAATLLRQHYPGAAHLTLGPCYDSECSEDQHPRVLTNDAGEVLVNFGDGDLVSRDYDLLGDLYDRLADVEDLGPVFTIEDSAQDTVSRLDIQAALDQDLGVAPADSGQIMLDQYAAFFDAPGGDGASRVRAAERLVHDLCAHLRETGVDPALIARIAPASMSAHETSMH